MARLILEDGRTSLAFNPLDHENEMEVGFMDKDGNTLGLMFLSIENLKRIQDYISSQLKNINNNPNPSYS